MGTAASLVAAVAAWQELSVGSSGQLGSKAAAWQECRVGGGGSAALAAASLAAEAAAWQERDIGNAGSSSTAVAVRQRRRPAWLQRWQLGGSATWQPLQRVGKRGSSTAAKTQHWRQQRGIGGGSSARDLFFLILCCSGISIFRE